MYINLIVDNQSACLKNFILTQLKYEKNSPFMNKQNGIKI